MTPEIKTTEYVAKLKDIQLSDSARARIQTNLEEYATFHVVGVDCAISSTNEVSGRTSLFVSKLVSVPLVILLAIMIGVGTTFAAQATVPGDVLYPVKIAVNERVRVALAVSADSEAVLQAELLEERLKEAQRLQAEGRLAADTAVTVATNISIQSKRAQAALDNSSNPVQVETKAKIALAFKNFLGSTTLDSALVSDIPTTFFASDQATGEYDITEYQTEMEIRTEALAKLMKKYQTKLEAKVYADLVAKQDEAIKLVTQAKTQSETDARMTLDKVATVAGEIESKLSLLGQVKIDSDTGIITDIDFSIDPLKIDRGKSDAFTNSATSSSDATVSSKDKGAQMDTSSKNSDGPNSIDATVDAVIGSSSNLNL